MATGTSQRRLAALPALSRIAAAWPLQPIAQRLSQVVVVIDESVLLLASASNDMSPEARTCPMNVYNKPPVEQCTAVAQCFRIRLYRRQVASKSGRDHNVIAM